MDPGEEGHQRAEDCALPPMKFRFTPQDIAGTLLEGVDQIYFTPVCNPSRRYEQYLLGEYQIYASFNLLTDLSYRVRLARVRYVDTQSDESRTVIAMLGEHQEVMAARNGMRPFYPEAVSRQRIDPQQAAQGGARSIASGSNQHRGKVYRQRADYSPPCTSSPRHSVAATRTSARHSRALAQLRSSRQRSAGLPSTTARGAPPGASKMTTGSIMITPQANHGSKIRNLWPSFCKSCITRHQR